MYTYVAFGSGKFPDDMLRYDRAEVLLGPLHLHDPLPEEEMLIPVNLRWSYYIIRSERMPTIERWNSFLWGVTMLRSQS